MGPTHGRGRVGHVIGVYGVTWGSWWPYQFSSFYGAPWMSARLQKSQVLMFCFIQSSHGTSLVETLQEINISHQTESWEKSSSSSKVPDWDGILFVPRRVCFPFACQAKAVQPMTDRGLVQAGCWRLDTSPLHNGWDMMLCCFVTGWFFADFIWYSGDIFFCFVKSHFFFRPGCQLHFGWRIVNCASGECGAAQPLATLGFRAPESDEFQETSAPSWTRENSSGDMLRPEKTTRSQGPAISVEECQHLSCCKKTGSESRYKI